MRSAIYQSNALGECRETTAFYSELLTFSCVYYSSAVELFAEEKEALLDMPENPIAVKNVSWI